MSVIARTFPLPPLALSLRKKPFFSSFINNLNIQNNLDSSNILTIIKDCRKNEKFNRGAQSRALVAIEGDAFLRGHEIESKHQTLEIRICCVILWPNYPNRFKLHKQHCKLCTYYSSSVGTAPGLNLLTYQAIMNLLP